MDDSYSIYCALQHQRRAQLLLRIPVTDVSQYSVRPLKWLRYVTGAILGTEGSLESLDETGQNFDLEDEQSPRRNLLFIPTLPIRLIDSHGLDHLTSSQVTTESRDDFQDEVYGRDESCVITGQTVDVCEAAYLIPHSKGSQYIQTVCCLRTGNEQPEIENINDVRNGILLSVGIHRQFTRNGLAILRTPNFAMTTNDALPIPNQPNVVYRFTPHYFIPEGSNWQTHPQDMRYPVNFEGWPPDFLWDFIYGIVISKKYGVTKTLDALSKEVSSEYYPESIRAAEEGARAELDQNKRLHERKVEEQNEPRNERARRGADNEDLMDAYDRVLGLWIHSHCGPLGQERRAKEEAAILQAQQEQNKLKSEEVMKWQKGVEEATD